LTTRTYLAFDYGTKRIGIAVGRSGTRQAQPLETVSVRGGRPDWARITRLITEWQPDAFVVGLPLNMDDTDNDLTEPARRFGRQLAGRYNLAVHMVDERLTTRAATDALWEAGASGQRLRAGLDPVAAQLILETFLNEQDGVAGERE
jgi:putative Holliday junction resolvase